MNPSFPHLIFQPHSVPSQRSRSKIHPTRNANETKSRNAFPLHSYRHLARRISIPCVPGQLEPTLERRSDLAAKLGNSRAASSRSFRSLLLLGLLRGWRRCWESDCGTWIGVKELVVDLVELGEFREFCSFGARRRSWTISPLSVRHALAIRLDTTTNRKLDTTKSTSALGSASRRRRTYATS